MIRTLREQGGGISVDELLGKAKTVDLKGQEVLLVAEKIEAMDTESVEAAVNRVTDRIQSGIVVLGAAIDGKAVIVCSVSKELTGKVKAGDLARNAAAIVGGGGGGKPDWAKAGGKDPSKLEEALSRIEEFLK